MLSGAGSSSGPAKCPVRVLRSDAFSARGAWHRRADKRWAGCMRGRQLRLDRRDWCRSGFRTQLDREARISLCGLGQGPSVRYYPDSPGDRQPQHQYHSSGRQLQIWWPIVAKYYPLSNQRPQKPRHRPRHFVPERIARGMLEARFLLRSGVLSRDQRFAEPIVLADGGKLGPLRPAGERGSIRRGVGGRIGALGPSGPMRRKIERFPRDGPPHCPRLLDDRPPQERPPEVRWRANRCCPRPLHSGPKYSFRWCCQPVPPATRLEETGRWRKLSDR
jgi:hypothetical protein